MTGTIQALETEFGAPPAVPGAYRDGIPTFWTHRDHLHRVLAFLKERVQSPYNLLYDLTAIDERARTSHPDEQHNDFTLVYHLFSFDRNQYIRVKTPLDENVLSVDTITDLWPAANWYERKVWDMFGIKFSGHPHLTRILMPRTWEGHPLRKDHPARATEMGEFRLPEAKEDAEQDALRFRPEEWGIRRQVLRRSCGRFCIAVAVGVQFGDYQRDRFLLLLASHRRTIQPYGRICRAWNPNGTGRNLVANVDPWCSDRSCDCHRMLSRSRLAINSDHG